MVSLDLGANLVDVLLFHDAFGGQKYAIAIEMRCYRTLAASGGYRGATDIFMKDIYEDFYLLEL